MKTFVKNIVLVVDGFSTGAFIAPALKARGYSCIHLLSSTTHPKKHTINSADYLELIEFKTIQDLLTQLSSREIMFCIPGDESGVLLADQISHALNLPNSNGIQYSLAKRNKYLMNEVVSKAGLSVVRHFQAAELQALIEWITEIGTWPIVLKPLDSASGDNVHICQNIGEVTTHFYNISSSHNKFGNPNKEVLAEEFNPGTEYIVNLASCAGQHHVVEIWRMSKFERTIVHDTCEFVNRNEEKELFLNIQSYCFKVLDAFEIKFGACTIELKCTDGRSPVLIELGARLMGDAELGLTYDLLGYNQLTLMLDAYLAPNVFYQACEQASSNLSHALAVLLVSSSEGCLVQPLAIIPYLNSLSCLFSYQIPDVGDTLSVTRNIATCPGVVYLKHNDKDELHKAYAAIRAFEQAGLYEKAMHTTISDLTLDSYIQNTLGHNSSLVTTNVRQPLQYFGDDSTSKQNMAKNQNQKEVKSASAEI